MHANMGIVASSVWVRKGMKDSYGKLSGKKKSGERGDFSAYIAGCTQSCLTLQPHGL